MANETLETITQDDIKNINPVFANRATEAELDALEAKSFDIASLIPSDWEADDSGKFPPYWTPIWDEKNKKGNGFKAFVQFIDDTNPEFLRYVLKASVDMVCRRGSKLSNSVERIRVSAGQQFTVSGYATMPLEMYEGLEVGVVVTGKRMLPPNEESEGKPRDLYDFTVCVSPEDKRRLESVEVTDQKALEARRNRFRREGIAGLRRLREARKQGMMMSEDEEAAMAAM